MAAWLTARLLVGGIWIAAALVMAPFLMPLMLIVFGPFWALSFVFVWIFPPLAGLLFWLPLRMMGWMTRGLIALVERLLEQGGE